MTSVPYIQTRRPPKYLLQLAIASSISSSNSRRSLRVGAPSEAGAELCVNSRPPEEISFTSLALSQSSKSEKI